MVFFTILFDLGEIVVSKINASETRDGRYVRVDVPEVPGSKQDDDYRDNFNNFRDYHNNAYEDTRRPGYDGSMTGGPCGALIEKLRTEFSQNDATIRLRTRGNVHNRGPMSCQVFSHLTYICS